LEKLPQHEQQRVQHSIDALGNTPRPHGSKKLTDRGNEYSVRVPPYRIVYSIDDAPDYLVTVLVIRDRKDVYRRR